MIEAHDNRLAFASQDKVQWPANMFGPNLTEFWLAEYQTRTTHTSVPIAMHGMEIATFQVIFTPDEYAEPSYYGIKPHFQVSQDGIHWDDIPDDSFSVDLSTVVVDGQDCSSVTIGVLTTSNYIRFQHIGADAPNHFETEPAACDRLTVVYTLKEA